MNTQTAVQQSAKSERAMEYVPFGAVDKIKLNVVVIQQTVCIPTKSGKVCTERDAIRFMMLCQAQRLNPFAGDCFLCGYDGKNGPVFSLIVAHVSFLKRAETCEDFEGMESGIILCDDNGVVTEREGDFKLSTENCVGGWARVFRKGRKQTYRRLSIAAMIPPYETPFWSDHKAPGQICKCAEADALRATFPTLLGGLHAGEEISPMIDISPGAGEMLAMPKQLAEAALQAALPPAAPAQEKEKATTQAPQQTLSDIVLTAGFTFNEFAAWGEGSGNVPDASSLPGFEAVSSEIASRLLRAKTGMLKAMEAAKGAQ